MQYSHEVEQMICVAKGARHNPAPIPEEGKWVCAKEITDISGLTHGVGWCAPQQGACKLTLNVKNGIIEEALVETLGCSGMTHSAAMAAEVLSGKTILEALNTDLVCGRHKRSHAGIVSANCLRPHSDRLFRKRPAHRSRAGGFRQRPALPGGNNVLHAEKGRPLS